MGRFGPVAGIRLARVARVVEQDLVQVMQILVALEAGPDAGVELGRPVRRDVRGRPRPLGEICASAEGRSRANRSHARSAGVRPAHQTVTGGAVVLATKPGMSCSGPPVTRELAKVSTSSNTLSCWNGFLAVTCCGRSPSTTATASATTIGQKSGTLDPA